MRGFTLLERFAEERGLDWARVDPDLDRYVSDARSDQRLRTVLWAGLRALATMTQNFPAMVRTPWMWLAQLDTEAVDSVADILAERDADRVEESDEDKFVEVNDAANAHLLIRISLLHPELFRSDAEPDLIARLVARAGEADPLIHLLYHVAQSLEADSLRSVARSPEDSAVREAAARLAGAVQDIDDEPDAMDGLFGVLEDLTSEKDGSRRGAFRMFLAVVRRAGEFAGPERVRAAANELIRYPAELACVISDDSGIEGSIRRHLLAKACLVDPRVAAGIAESFPELTSDDPRDEPALRNEARGWWSRSVATAKHETVAAEVSHAIGLCPARGKALLDALAADHGCDDPFPASQPTADVVAAVAEAVSALALASDAEELPFEVLA